MTRPMSPSCWSTTRPAIFTIGMAGICPSLPMKLSHFDH
jgi:hypothetical protein